MRREPPLLRELWDQIPPPVQAALLLVVESYEQRIAGLEAQVAELQGELRELRAQLGQNSQNSSRLPSSDGPHVKCKPPRAPSGRKRGGQPGHPVHQRALLLVEQVDEVVVRKPMHCRRCGEVLHGSDAAPLRQQVIEVPLGEQDLSRRLPRERARRWRITKKNAKRITNSYRRLIFRTGEVE